MAVPEIGRWVWPENVRTTVQYLSLFVGYDFDDTDWQAIRQGLTDTTCEPPERWYDYPIVGTPTLTVFLALDPGADPVFVRVRGDMDEILRTRIDTLLSVLADVRPPTSAETDPLGII